VAIRVVEASDVGGSLAWIEIQIESTVAGQSLMPEMR
jgi:hypothetical protein